MRRPGILIGACTLCWLALGATVAIADTAPLVRYQGQAADSNGVPLEGPYTLTFRLYAAQTGGSPNWTEQQPNVPVSGGYFSVLLGQVTSLGQVDWRQPLWLSIQVNMDPELAPRQQITSVPLAIVAQQAEQLTAPLDTAQLNDTANRLVPAGAIILWTGSSCPAGYTRAAALDGRFLVGAPAYNSNAGGSLAVTTDTQGAHTHSLSIDSYTWSGLAQVRGGSDGAWTFTWPHTGGGTSVSHSHTGSVGSAGSHSHTISDVRPPFANILLCQRS